MSEPTTASAETPLDRHRLSRIDVAAKVLVGASELGDQMRIADVMNGDTPYWRRAGEDGDLVIVLAREYLRLRETERATTVPSDSDEGSRPATALLGDSCNESPAEQNSVKPTAQQALERALAVWEFASQPSDPNDDPLYVAFRSLVERGRGSGAWTGAKMRVCGCRRVGGHCECRCECHHHADLGEGVVNHCLFKACACWDADQAGWYIERASRGSAGPGDEQPPA